MKKLLVALGTSALLASGVAVADKGGDRMLKRLDLTPEQQTQIQALSQAHRTQMMTLRQGHLTEIRALLTPEQQAQFDERVAKYQAKMQKRMQKHGSYGG